MKIGTIGDDDINISVFKAFLLLLGVTALTYGVVFGIGLILIMIGIILGI